jgi:hypothetical protein
MPCEASPERGLYFYPKFCPLLLSRWIAVREIDVTGYLPA